MSERIDSPGNAVFKMVKKLQTGKGRNREGLFLCEGIKPAREALKAGIKPRLIIISDNASGREEEEVEKIAGTGVEIRRMRPDLFGQLAGTVTPQNVIFVGFIRKNRWESFCGGQPLMILDRVQDPGNTGTIFRTCDAAGLLDVVVLEGTADFYNPKVLRSSAGGIFHLRLWYANKAVDVLERLKEMQYNVVCADTGGSRKVFELEYYSSQALVVGNESRGPDPVFLRGADQRLLVPMPGGVESLNVSVAAGVLVYERLRKSELVQDKAL